MKNEKKNITFNKVFYRETAIKKNLSWHGKFLEKLFYIVDTLRENLPQYRKMPT